MGRPPMPRDDRGEIVRPPLRTETDSLSRAQERARAIREARIDQPELSNEFDIPLNMIPQGWTYEWRRYSVLGKEDPQNMMEMNRLGFEPVPASRHPELMPAGYAGETIIKKGQILMERPSVLTDESRAREKLEADRTMADKKASLGEATTQLDSGKQAKVDAKYYSREIPAD